jgi:hypothetical protein
MAPVPKDLHDGRRPTTAVERLVPVPPVDLTTLDR